jgi:hypothetical protein
MKLESFSLKDLNHMVLALRRLARRFRRGAGGAYDTLADRIWGVVQQVERAHVTPVHVTGTVPQDSRQPVAGPTVPLLPFSVVDLENLRGALVEDAAALSREAAAGARGSSKEVVAMLKVDARAVKTIAARVRKLHQQALKATAANLVVP